MQKRAADNAPTSKSSATFIEDEVQDHIEEVIRQPHHGTERPSYGTENHLSALGIDFEHLSNGMVHCDRVEHLSEPTTRRRASVTNLRRHTFPGHSKSSRELTTHTTERRDVIPRQRAFKSEHIAYGLKSGDIQQSLSESAIDGSQDADDDNTMQHMRNESIIKEDTNSIGALFSTYHPGDVLEHEADEGADVLEGLICDECLSYADGRRSRPEMT